MLPFGILAFRRRSSLLSRCRLYAFEALRFKLKESTPSDIRTRSTESTKSASSGPQCLIRALLIMTLDKITYGRAGEQCVFTKSTRNHDLYPRESKPRLTIDVQESNTDSITVSTKSTALVIVDMMNLFLDPSLMNHTAGRRLIGPIIKVIERCRELGIQVLYIATISIISYSYEAMRHRN